MMKYLLFPIVIFLLIACEPKNKGKIINAGNINIASVVKANFKNDYTKGVSIQVNAHKTPYWGVGHEMYEDFPGSNHANMNKTMISFNYVMTIPLKPGAAELKEQTSLGAVGMALNGTPIYNDYEGGGKLQENAWGTFDAAGAHPGPREDYHYHCEGAYISIDNSNMIGFIRDGFPVYGRKDMDGSYPTNLDENGGHIGVTEHFPNGIYHYHISNEVYSTSGLYIIKSGAYHGTKGMFTQ